jgi:voltage-gated potassium channel
VFRNPSAQHNFLYLFAALVLFMTVLPVVAEFSRVTNTLVTELSLTLVLLIGVWSLEGNRWVFRTGLALMTVAALLSFSYFFRPHVGIVHVVRVLSVVFLLLSAAITFRSVFLAGEVNLNRLAGAASLYLIIALIWTLLYSLLYAADPGSISGLPAQPSLWDCLYFSLTTLTTLGYGDVLPVSAPARTLAGVEVALGQFYLTILVAALVGMHVANRGAGRH